MKASNLILEAKRNNIKLKFKSNYNNEIKPMTYKEIVELKELDKKISSDVKELEKNYHRLVSENSINDLSKYEIKLEKKNNLNLLILKVMNEDNYSLKNILDSLANKYENIFMLIANINDNQATYIGRSNSKVDAGSIIKKIALETNGNGGGSLKFAMGSGKDIKNIDAILENIKKDIDG